MDELKSVPVSSLPMIVLYGMSQDMMLMCLQIMATIERILYATDEEESRQAMLETQQELSGGIAAEE